MGLEAIACLDAKHAQPFNTQSHGRARARRHTPGGRGRQGNGIVSPPRRRVRSERNRARGARRSRRETKEWHGSPPFDVNERETTPPPLPKLVAEQRSVAAEDKRAVRWQCRCRETELHARKNAGATDRGEHVPRTADARIIARAVLYAPSAFNRELGGEVMADCEAFTAPAQGHCSGRVIAVGDRGIEPIAARRGRRVHRLSRDALPCRHQAHFASAAETPPHSESHPCGAIVIAVVI